MNWKVFMTKLLERILGSVSINLLETLKQFAEKFREDARQTDNPWDDILADLICGLLGIPEEQE